MAFMFEPNGLINKLILKKTKITLLRLGFDETRLLFRIKLLDCLNSDTSVRLLAENDEDVA